MFERHGERGAPFGPAAPRRRRFTPEQSDEPLYKTVKLVSEAVHPAEPGRITYGELDERGPVIIDYARTSVFRSPMGSGIAFVRQQFIAERSSQGLVTLPDGPLPRDELSPDELDGLLDGAAASGPGLLD